LSVAVPLERMVFHEVNADRWRDLERNGYPRCARRLIRALASW